MRAITILGATGSVGSSTLDLIRRHRGEWRVVALTANCQAEELARLAREFSAKVAVVGDESCLPLLREALAGSGIEAAAGAQALVEAASRPADLTVAAVVGCAGLAPVMAAIEQGRTIALANKEALVSAGAVMTAAVARHGATLLPVDSEHNAIFQCLAGNRIEDVAEAVIPAIARAREGQGPTLVECKTYRIRGHSKSDRNRYRSKEEIIRAVLEVMFNDWNAVYQEMNTESFTMEALRRTLRINFNLVWKYRFFYRELTALLRNDEILAARYAIIQEHRIAEQEILTKQMTRFAGVPPMSKIELRNMVLIGWILSSSWLSYVESTGRTVDESAMDDGVKMLFQYYKPYLEKLT